ncbi:BTAD domain-containing putative transcriptional regulator [Actinosynnema sp. CA-299493]
MSVTFGLLGDIRAHAAGEPLDLGHARQRCVLAALLVDANRPLSLDLLIERVWGVRAPRQARSTLYGYLYRLRQAFAAVPGVSIDRRAGGYLLPVEEDAVDLHRFRSLVKRSYAAEDDGRALALADEALGLWRGLALGGVDGDWATAVRRSLEQERWTALLHRNDVALRLGHHEALLADLAASTDENPLDERLAGQFVLALYRSGRQSDALRHYQVVRRRLAEELGVDPGPGLRELHQHVLAGELPAPSARVIAPTPRQLPAAPRLYVGRANELARMDKLLDPPAVLAIVGAGGAGKTWLALHWAHRAADRFPDGQLHLDLHGFDPLGRPTPPAAALRAILVALGAEPDHDRDLDALAAHFRTLVAGRRMLVVLDNAHDEAQVTPLLPGSPTCAVLVTSRQRLTTLATAHGAQHLTLEPMTAADAADVLARHLGHDRLAAHPGAQRSIIEHCAGLPLALSIAAARAAVHPDLPLSVVADELRDDRLDSLRAVFAASYQALDAEAARVLRLVAAAPGPDVEVRSAAALTGLPVPTIRAALRRLENSHMVDRRGAHRYRMHDLVRLYTTEQHAEGEEGALAGLLDFYVATAHAAGELSNSLTGIVPAPGTTAPLEFGGFDEATAWLDAEHSCLIAAQEWAVRHGAHSAVWHLAWALDRLHWRRGLLDTHLETWRAGIAAAEHLGPWYLAQGHRSTSQVLMRAGDHEGAMRHLHAALAVLRRTDFLVDQGHVTHSIAAGFSFRGEHAQAVEYAEHALALYRRAGAEVWEANALNTLGWLLAKTGRLEQGRRHCAQAVVLCRALGYQDGEAAARDSLAHIAHTTGALHRAVGHYRRTLHLRRILGDPYEEADALVSLGRVHRELGQPGEAGAAWQRAMALYREQGRRGDEETVTALLAAVDGTDR